MSWLPAAPDDFSARAKILRSVDGAISAELTALAGHALDGDQLLKLSRIVEKVRAAGDQLDGLIPFKLGIISNATTDFVVPAVIGTGLRHGLAIECITTDFGQHMQAALDPASAINAAGCQAVLLALDARAFALDSAIGDGAAAEAAQQQALSNLVLMAETLGEHCPTIVLQTLPHPAEALFGSFDGQVAGTATSQIAALNRSIVARAAATADRLLDIAGLAASCGLHAWHDPIAWHMAKQPFAFHLIPLYADHLCRLLAAIRGKSRKALVLDCDNTLWAGVIGDDGMAGINIAQGDPTGEAHLALQHYALALRQRGIVLAVSSKNTDEVARQVFREHPDMLLREDHIAVFQANWNDKASNLQAIAEALNIGVDALVFVDDNPAERALVRQRLPQVAVPELPADPAFYVRTVAAAGYFEADGFSEEDRQRAGFYSDNARRVALQSAVGGIDDYLRSLAMVLRLTPFDEAGRSRIAQLINKSNQFNLTTRRYTEAEIAAIASNPTVFTLQVRLEDRFGDNGMISSVIARQKGDAWKIDAWLMSCRVLGRRVEQAVLHQIAAAARSAGAARLIGLFIPSGRNGIVADHYAKLGFTADGTAEDGTERWTLDLAAPLDSACLEVFTQIHSVGMAPITRPEPLQAQELLSNDE